MRWRAVLASSTSALALLAVAVLGTQEMTFEHFWADPLRAHRSAGLTTAMSLFTLLGDNRLLAVLVMAVSLRLAALWEKGGLVAVYLLNLVANPLLKALFRRGRPDAAFDPLVQEPFYSFPSGHTMASAAVYGFLASLLWRHGHPRLAAVTLLPIALVGLSRVYLGAHFPTDVVGGILAGTVVIALVYSTRK
ncbi:PAP2 family protein [bacterium CPR1]|nr:PAP2 family protein [bacterium CPR1]